MNLGKIGSTTVRQKHIFELAQKVSGKSRFTTEECKSLLTMYQRIAAYGKVDRLRFREVIHAVLDITDDVMLDRVYRVFDKDNDGIISETEWIEGLSILCRGTPEHYIDFCYQVYDINGDKSLARDELNQCLKGSLSPYQGVLTSDELEESLREIVEIAMKKLDRDKDGQITMPDFQNACYHDPILLQAIGPCLPPARSLAAFMALFTENYRSYSSEWNDEWRQRQKKMEDERLAAAAASSQVRGSSSGMPRTSRMKRKSKVSSSRVDPASSCVRSGRGFR